MRTLEPGGTRPRRGWLLSFALLAVSSACTIQEFQKPLPPPQERGQTPPPPADSSEIDPRALERLHEMATFLRNEEAFAVRAEIATVEISDTGQKIERKSAANLSVTQPNRLHVGVSADRDDRELYYDGKRFTIYTPGERYYSTVDAPPVLSQLTDFAWDRYGIEIPIAELLRWGTDDWRSLRSAVDLGPSRIDEVPCDHYAFRQTEVDWQLWIERGERPLPRRLVITTMSAAAQPQHEVTYRWAANASIPDSTFRFTPPKDAHPIPLDDLRGKSGPVESGAPKAPEARIPSGKLAVGIVTTLTAIPSDTSFTQSARVSQRGNVNPNTRVNRGTLVERATGEDANTTRGRTGDVDVDRGWNRPMVAGAAVAAAAIATSATLGAAASAVPGSCSTVVVDGATFKKCRGTWYQPRYSGTRITYVVVEPPRAR